MANDIRKDGSRFCYIRSPEILYEYQHRLRISHYCSTMDSQYLIFGRVTECRFPRRRVIVRHHIDSQESTVLDQCSMSPAIFVLFFPFDSFLTDPDLYFVNM